MRISNFLVFYAIALLALPFFGPGLAVSSQDETGVKSGNAGKIETIVVSAEGLVDPNADTYKRDKGLMIDDLRRDAQRQAVEKAVGTYVESSTLVENYLLVSDKVLTKSQGMIKQIIKETEPSLGEDGLMHLFIKAEVVLSNVKAALDSMSKAGRVSLIKQHGNPTISVAVMVKDADRASGLIAENSTVAENILKEHFSAFGYRVWSEDYTKILQKETSGAESERRVADFSVLGEAKFKSASVVLRASKLKVTTYSLTSWTVKCINNHTGEEIYFNNQIPKKKSWPDEDNALEDIGRQIGGEFSTAFFEQHLLKPSSIYQVSMLGLPDYDTGLLFKKEFIGLRPVLNVELRNFDARGASTYEIEFAGSNSNFAQVVNNTVINPLNMKLGQNAFKLMAHHGEVLEIQASLGDDAAQIQDRVEGMAPAALVSAPVERIREVVKSAETMEKLVEMNPELAGVLERGAQAEGAKGPNLRQLENF